MTLRLLAVALSLGAVVWACGAPASGQPASSEIVTSAHVILAWYATARTAPATPVQLSRVLAMVHAAMHDAVNGAEPRYETYVSDLIDSRAHPEAAAAGAAHRVLSGLFPGLQASWDAALAESLSAIPDGRTEAAGVTLGAAVGQVILNVRADDGWNSVDPFDPEPKPGIWRPTPPALLPMTEPQFQNVTPFTIESRAQFSLAPPPTLTARDYQRVFDEVKSIGQDTSATRTADQTHIAHFWFEPPYDSWSRIAGILQSDKGYDLHQTARLYALVNMAWPTASCPGGTGRGSTRSGDRSRPFGKRISTAIRPPPRIPRGSRCAPRLRIPIIRRPTASPEAPLPKSSAGSWDRTVIDSA